MKFKEKNAKTISEKELCLVYFLLDGEEVVYVGQTRNGISRPLCHTDKIYDTIKVIYVPRNLLDIVENYYICKYKPKYNIKITEYYTIEQAIELLNNTLEIGFDYKYYKNEADKYGIDIIKIGKKEFVSVAEERKMIFSVLKYMIEQGYSLPVRRKRHGK